MDEEDVGVGYGKFTRCIICNSYTTTQQCFNILTTKLENGDILLSEFLKNVLGCSVLIIVPPDFFLCKSCYKMCCELDYIIARCDKIQTRIKSLFQTSRANQEAIYNGAEPIEVKVEPDLDDEFYYNQEENEDDNLAEEVPSEETYNIEEANNYDENTEYEDPQYEYTQYEDTQYEDTQYEDKQYEDKQYEDKQYEDKQYEDPQYEDTQYGDTQYEETQCTVSQSEGELVIDDSSQLIEDGIVWEPGQEYYEEAQGEYIIEEIVKNDESNEPADTGGEPQTAKLKNGESKHSTQNHNSTSKADQQEYTPVQDLLGMIWLCKPCKMKFSNLESLKRHKRSSTCNSNSKRFGIKSAYEYKNYTVKLKKKQKVFYCNYCTFEAPSSDIMEKHVVSHKSDPPLMCDICGRRFKTRSTFKRHQLVHDESRPFACKQCTFRSETELTLKIHQRMHDDQKKFTCSKCGYKTIRKMSYISHLRTHTGERPYCCPDCPYRSKDSSTLIRHRRTHGGLKRYHCSVCDYKALQKNSLTRHMMIHTGEKPHTCPHCDYSSTMKHNLADHIAAKHSTEKPFACDICSYKTKAKRLLKYHMRIHSGEKPYACSVCDFRVRHRAGLSYHMKTKHPPKGTARKIILKFVHTPARDMEFTDEEEEDYELNVIDMDE